MCSNRGFNGHFHWLACVVVLEKFHGHFHLLSCALLEGIQLLSCVKLENSMCTSMCSHMSYQRTI